MARTDSFRRQHDDILKTAGELGALLNASALQTNSQPATSLLMKLAGQLKVHLAMEDNSLYPKMLSSDDEKVKVMAKNFMDEMGGIAVAFTSYVDKWKVHGAIQSDSSGFIKDTNGIFAALTTRVDKENNKLYPLVDSL